jgi:hypothetical protein
MYSAIPAFWDPPAVIAQNHSTDWWAQLRSALAAFPAAGKKVVVVIGEDSWVDSPGSVSRSDIQQNVIDLLHNATGCTVLGYADTRDAAGNVDPSLALDRAKGWFDPNTGWPGLDGIYFDELVSYSDPPNSYGANVSLAQQLVQQYHAQFRATNGKKMMILCGQCKDEWVVAGPPGAPDAAPDWVLMWEERIDVYRNEYYPIEDTSQHPQQPVDIPDWWKNPVYRSKIAHTVHHCMTDQDWQDAVGLANERNVGSVFVLDTPGGPNQDRYDHLASWFDTATGWINSYNDASTGLPDHKIVFGAHRWATRQGMIHAWPNFEAAWYGGHQVRGTYLLHNPAGVQRHVLSPAQLGLSPPPPIYNLSRLWGALHSWALRHGFLTAMPTCEPLAHGEIAAITFDRGLTWASHGYVDVASTYQQPTFAEAGAVVRNVHRRAEPQHTTAFPTFRAALQDDATGRTLPNGRAQYESIFITFPKGTQIGGWSDVQATTYAKLANG